MSESDFSMISKSDYSKVSSIVGETLAERFAGEFVFDPIVVIPETDYLDDDFKYLRIYIVFDGDQARLDPGWTAGLIRRLLPKLMAVGVDEFPSPSFVKKSDWPRVEKKLRKIGKLEIASA